MPQGTGVQEGGGCVCGWFLLPDGGDHHGAVKLLPFHLKRCKTSLSLEPAFFFLFFEHLKLKLSHVPKVRLWLEKSDHQGNKQQSRALETAELFPPYTPHTEQGPEMRGQISEELTPQRKEAGWGHRQREGQ